MKNEIKMPKLRPEMESGILCAWLKEPGEKFKKGEPIFEVETEKVVSQIEAAEDGVITKLLAEEGDEINVGEVIAEIEIEKVD
ncbi:MAG: lipA [Clostridia bacterium]|jgi:pyruvate/2-oxoglutarate dehydrogenase complex dihydrolipoamide acyltransferase (E2) component|nr:lipA [Clostridia bacterium]HAE62156.1 biotin attachment protein [Eubacteriaceae bacterium]